MRRPAAIFLAYVLLAAVATWPLVRDMRTAIAADRADPVLNASVLLWNARVVPFTQAWWNPPHFYPSDGVVAFTENLIGISPVASPTYWLTGNALLAYNLPLFLTWPLSAFAAYALVRFLTGRDDAAFLGGLAFGFSPYRAVAFPHIQTLATFGVPLLLLGMHGYIRHQRWPWLLLFGVAWLQQALANGYYVFYAGLLIGLWLMYFCSSRETWKAGAVLLGTLAIFSVPLVPMLLGYRAVHDQYGMHRAYFEILYFSALTRSWFETHADVWLWRHVFPAGKDNMFPGITALAIAVIGIVWLLIRRDASDGWTERRTLRKWLAIGVVVSAAAIVVNLAAGRIDTTVLGIAIKMTDVGRAVAVFVICGVAVLLLTPRTRAALERRSPLVFYAAATVFVALLSCGPELRTGDDVIWKPAPYAWLMALPGFNEIRVPTQIKMIDILCLAVAFGLAYRVIRPSVFARARVVFGIVAVALVIDGWMVRAEMKPPPEPWPIVEPAGRPEPILELPIGGGDYGATFRAALHGRRVLNGVSGYDPPHYFALVDGLTAHDPSTLSAIASLGPYDIVVDGDDDPDGSALRYAASAPGAVRAATDGRRTLFRVPGAAAEPPLGTPWPIAGVQTAHHRDWIPLMLDGKRETGWADLPDDPDAWVVADLGEVRDVAGITDAIADYPRDFPRHLVIDVSEEGEEWTVAWEGATRSQAFLAFVREPRWAALRFSFPAQRARYVRLRETERPTNWRIQELTIHAPVTEEDPTRGTLRPPRTSDNHQK